MKQTKAGVIISNRDRIMYMRMLLDDCNIDLEYGITPEEHQTVSKLLYNLEHKLNDLIAELPEIEEG